MDGQYSRLLMILLIASGLPGCGTVVPDIKEAWDGTYPGAPATATDTATPYVLGAGQIEFEIKRHVYCELKDAVRLTQSYAVEKVKVNGNTTTVVNKRNLIPDDWEAQVSLSLQVDESSALNPGVAFNTPMANAISTFGVVKDMPVTTSTPQLFSLGVGGTLSSTASRTDKFDPVYSIAKLSEPIQPQSVCDPDPKQGDPFERIGFSPAKSSPLIVSDLGLQGWLLGAMFTNDHLPSVPPASKPVTPRSLAADRAKYSAKGYTAAEITQILASQASSSGGGGGGGATPKPDTVSIEIKFVIVSNGNVTPTWKLLRVSANTGSTPLFGMGRTRTHDLIITIGPPTSTTANTHLASQIGVAVSNGNQTLLNATSPSNTFALPF
jgi:hypothetical protein